MRRWVQAALLLGALAPASGCVATRGHVSAEHLVYPVSLSSYLLAEDGHRLRYDWKKGGDLIQVGTLGITKSFWSCLWGLAPPTWTWDASEQINDQVRAKRGEGVVQFKLTAPAYTMPERFLCLLRLLIPFVPNDAEIRVSGTIVRRRRPGDPLEQPWVIAARRRREREEAERKARKEREERLATLPAPVQPAQPPPPPPDAKAQARVSHQQMLLNAWTAPDGAIAISVVASAVANGVDPNTTTDAQGRTILILAADHGKTKLVRYLLSNDLRHLGVRIDPSVRDDAGLTALDHARLKHHDGVVRLLRP